MLIEPSATVDTPSALTARTTHPVVYPSTGEARQQFAVCLHAVPVRGRARPDHDETCEAAWIEPDRLDSLPIHPSMRLRIAHALAEPGEPHAG